MEEKKRHEKSSNLFLRALNGSEPASEGPCPICSRRLLFYVRRNKKHKQSLKRVFNSGNKPSDGRRSMDEDGDEEGFLIVFKMLFSRIVKRLNTHKFHSAGQWIRNRRVQRRRTCYMLHTTTCREGILNHDTAEANKTIKDRFKWKQFCSFLWSQISCFWCTYVVYNITKCIVIMLY